ASATRHPPSFPTRRSSDLLGKAGQIIGAEQPNNEHDFDVSIGQAYALRTLSSKQIRQSAALAFDALAKRFKSDDPAQWRAPRDRSEEHTSELQSPYDLVCR